MNALRCPISVNHPSWDYVTVSHHAPQDILDTPRYTLTNPPALRQVHLALLHQPLQPQGVGQQDINLGAGSETAKGEGEEVAR